MEYYDYKNQTEVDFNDATGEAILDAVKNIDRGHTKIEGFIERADGSLKNTKIDIYTTGFMGSHIRDAETGEYYKNLVGSLDEDLFFKFRISSEMVNSKNGSNTLFYKSPQHCMRHLHCEIEESVIDNWEEKRNVRLASKRNEKKRTFESAAVFVK
jgi:hypothetical protein